MEQPLFIELIRRTKATLNTINKLTQLARGKFGDRDFGDFFYRAVTKDIEEHNFLLNTFLKYIESTTPIPKKDTVKKLIEDVLKKHQARLEEKKVRILKKCGKDLPETIVPDEQLRFILDSLLEYALAVIPSGGDLEVITKAPAYPNSAIEDREFLKKNEKYLELTIAFTGLREDVDQSRKAVRAPSPREEVLSDLVYRLVDRIVTRNKGTIEFEVSAKESKNIIFLRLPAERRKLVSYRLTNG